MPDPLYHSLQQVFDDAYRGLAAQGFRQSLAKVERIPDCCYRSFDDRRCAIGHCIPDELYDPAIEGSVATTDEIRNPIAHRVFTAVFGFVNRSTLGSLQAAHDFGVTPDEMCHRLAEFASRNGLTIPALPA